MNKNKKVEVKNTKIGRNKSKTIDRNNLYHNFFRTKHRSGSDTFKTYENLCKVILVPKF